TLPQLVAVDAVVGREEQRAVDVRQAGGRRAGSAGEDVLDEDGASGGAVRLSQFLAIDALVGGGEDQVADGGQLIGGGAVGGAAAQSGEDGLDEDGSGNGAVAPPQLRAVDAVVGGEDENAIEVGLAAGATAAERVDDRDLVGGEGGDGAIFQLLQPQAAA